MARNLDEFAQELTAAVHQAATNRAKTRALHAAAHAGDAATVRRIGESMTTAELQNLKQQIER